MRLPRSKWLITLAALLAAGGGFWFWRAGEAPRGGPPAEMSTAAVERGRVEYVLHEVGAVEARDSVQVRSRVSGKVKRLEVADGHEVKRGQTLVIIEPDVNEALSIVQRRSRVNELRENLQQKEKDLERSRQLAGQGYLSPQTLEQEDLDFQNLKRQFELERVSLEAVERDYGLPIGGRDFAVAPGAPLPDYSVAASLDGVIVELPVKAGELVSSGISDISREGSLLMTVADVRTLDVVCMISEVDIARLRIGHPAAVKVPSLPNEELHGTIQHISLSGVRNERNLVQFETIIHLDRPDHPALKPGMSCSVDVTTESADGVLRLPLTAFEEREGKAWVRLPPTASGEPPRKQEIELGLRGTAYVEVRSGLREGDKVVVGASSEETGERSNWRWRRM